MVNQMACDGKDCKYRDSNYTSSILWKYFWEVAFIDEALDFNDITEDEAKERRKWASERFNILRERGPHYKLPEVIERMKSHV